MIRIETIQNKQILLFLGIIFILFGVLINIGTGTNKIAGGSFLISGTIFLNSYLTKE